MFYTWLIIVVILSIIEIMTINLVSIWFVASGIIAMILSTFTNNLTIQISAFIIFGVIFMLCTKKIVKKLQPEKIKTNFDRIIGMQGKVTSKITKNNPGAVKVDGKEWTATSSETLEEGTNVEIIEINSTKIKVKRMEE